MPLSGYIKSKLIHSNRYLRFRYNERTLAFWKWFHREAAVMLRDQSNFYKKLLKPLKKTDVVIFDIGANEGFITQTLSQFGSPIVAVEPDPLNIRILQNRFSKNSNIIIVGKAVSDKVGAETLYIDQKGNALHTLNIKWKNLLESGNYILNGYFTQSLLVDTTTLPQLIEKFGCPAFIKIDAEGYEGKVLACLENSIPQVIFEAVLPHFFNDTIENVNHLCQIDKNSVFNYAVNYNLMLPQFVAGDDFELILQQVGNKSLDIVCRMSNYNDYYH